MTVQKPATELCEKHGIDAKALILKHGEGNSGVYDIKLAGFAAACFNDNYPAELVAPLVKSTPADKTDCKTWGITPTEWRDSIEAAFAKQVLVENNYEIPALKKGAQCAAPRKAQGMKM